jgi:lysophospholipase L1-like esterase
MNKFFVYLSVTILLLTACEKPAPIFKKLSADAVILAFGDSLTYGSGASQNADYPAILSTLSSHKIINAGVPGEISRNGLNRLPDLLDEYQPELLILIHGGNDMLRRIPHQQTSDNLKQMINEAKVRDISVILLGVPKFNLFLLSSAAFYQQVADEQKVPIDLETLPKILSTNSLKSDTIHPNNEGYRLMAENIYRLLVDSGAL